MNSNESNHLHNENISLEIPQGSFALKYHGLGEGTFGTVRLATIESNAGGRKKTIEAVARTLQLDKRGTESTALASWINYQARVWSSCSHENILKFIGYCGAEDFTFLYLFSPYMRNGNAETYLKTKNSTKEERFLLLNDTLKGLDYLHSLSPPVVHGNLRAANVLIDDNYRAVLSETNLWTLRDCVESTTGWDSKNLTRWSSPELFTISDRTTHSDVWAWGCLALEMMTGKLPFSAMIRNSNVRYWILQGHTPLPHPPPRNWPDGLLPLVRKCWSRDPGDRPDVRTCYESLRPTRRLIERFREDVVGFLGSSFIAKDRIQSGPDETLRQTGNRTTRKAELVPSGALVVVKELNLDEITAVSSRVDFLERFARQMAALSFLKHERILELIGYSTSYPFETVVLVAPNMVNGNLVDYMDHGLDMNNKLELARDTMIGLQYLHDWEPPVVHGNLTPFNVLISETGKAVLSDVGLAAIDWHPIATSPKASIRWSSPEVNIEDSAVVQSDIWSWACVVLQLATGDLPYSYLLNEDQIKMAMRSRRRDCLTPEPLHELHDIPDILMGLLRRCWNFAFLQRPNAGECIEALESMLNPDLGAPSGTGGQRYPDDDISRFVISISTHPLKVNGRFGDVFIGNHVTKGEVALKRLRIGSAGIDKEVIWRFEKEAETWRRLKHPHVLEFLGTYKPEAHIYFVSPFAKNGTLLEYVSNCPDINRVRLLCETSDAITYLHREDLVHGDIKASNLLISGDGHVLLCDFGLAKPVSAQTSTALQGAGTLRWQSPELWDNKPRTFASDVYAFSMTIVEALTGLPPFAHLENDVAVILAVYHRDERPVQSPLESSGVSYKNAWEVAEACWPTMAGARISMSEAFRLLAADPSLA